MLAIFLMFCAGFVYGQADGVAALQRWFSSAPDHSAYHSVEDELVQVFRQADDHSLPPSLLIERLNLGVARRLPPELLVRGMREELARLRSAQAIVSQVSVSHAGHSFVARSTRTNLLNTVSIYLSGGLSQAFLSTFLVDSAASGKSPDDIFRACAVLLRLQLTGEFSREELLAFGRALVNSSVAPAAYTAVGSFVVRLAATGRGGSGLLPAVSRVLHQGGGLPQMELELGRRR